MLVIIKIKRSFFLIASLISFIVIFSHNLLDAAEAPTGESKKSYSQLSNLDEKRFRELKSLNYLLLIDQDSGEILLEKNIDEIIAPSSMTKLMTAYTVFMQIKNGSINLDNQCLIGKDAWRKKGSSMFLNHGDVVSIDELLTGLIVVSGNDSAVALAQSVSGSVKLFAKLMNKTAKEAGLTNSNFKNPHGLNQENHYMTIRDLAILTRKMVKDFPEFMHYFSTKKFTYEDITQRNSNPLFAAKYEGATGMKTGYTSDGGYGFVGTASRGNRNLIGVVNNALTPTQRKKAIIELLDYGFNDFEKINFFNKGDSVAKANVWLGKKDQVDLVTLENININIFKDRSLEDLVFEVNYKDPIFTPIKENQEVGRLVIKNQGRTLREVKLYAKEKVKKASYFIRMGRVLKYKLQN